MLRNISRLVGTVRVAHTGVAALPVPGDGERGAQLAPEPGVQAAAAPRRARHVLHVVVQPPRRVPAVHVVHVREAVFTPPLDRVVVRQKRVQPESSVFIKKYSFCVGGEHVQEYGLDAVLMRRLRHGARQVVDEHVQ